MKLIDSYQVIDVEYFVDNSFDTRQFYENKITDFDIIPFVYITEEPEFKNIAKVVLTFDLHIKDIELNKSLLKYITEKTFIFELDGNKDFKMLRRSVFDSFLTFQAIFTRRAGYQLSIEILKKEIKDFDELTYRVLNQIP